MTSLYRRARRTAGILLDGGAWKPGHLRKLADGIVHVDRPGRDDGVHLRATAEWLCRAQDATPDGGVCGRYFLDSGWSSSYPETTGYLVPTFLALDRLVPELGFEARARRCVEFLLDLQLESGAFPGMEIAENTTEASFFNTAQILNGLLAWHRHSDEAGVAEAARRASDWLVSIQDEDGGYTQYTYGDSTYTYGAHATCWLAESGLHFDDARYLEAAGRHLDWVLGFYEPETGWIDKMGFDHMASHEARRSVTHTIAYTIWGVLFTSQALGRADGVEVARHAAHGVMRRTELSRKLPGELDHRWRKAADYECLTGNAQMALIWMRLYRDDGDARWLNAACLALDRIKAAQSLDNADPGIRGGVSGSVPMWGDYIRMGLPNWAAKFFVDALLEKRALLDTIDERPRGRVAVRSDLPRGLPAPPPPATRRQRVVFYSRPDTTKLAEMLTAWAGRGLEPDAVVLETLSDAPAAERLRERLHHDGFGPLLDRFRSRRDASPDQAPALAEGPSLADAETFCREHGLHVVRTGPLSRPESVEAVRALEPDLAVHAGAGILRAPLLGVPRLGTLNAHMGLLPWYRGMNVAEWACFNGDAVGPTVHLIDPGIDEGEILCVRPIDAGEASTIEALRQAVNTAQLELLGEVLAWIREAGVLPPTHRHEKAEGRQFFRMHPALRAVLARELEKRA